MKDFHAARIQVAPPRTCRKRPLKTLLVCLCVAATSHAWIHNPGRGQSARRFSIIQRLPQTVLRVNGDQYSGPDDRPSIPPTGTPFPQHRSRDPMLYHYLEGIRRQLDQQQVQINRLLQLVQQPQQQKHQEYSVGGTAFEADSGVNESHEQRKNVSKAMLFIDGTWLYYSLFERKGSECPLVVSFGRHWQTRYRVNWDALPGLIQRHLQENAPPGVTVQLTKCLVYTSSRPDTSEYSARYSMFEDMQACPMMEVHQMETTGKSEKCVDLALAVDVVHLSRQYDTAILLSGDKDFMPALYRIRQSGNKVALASMRRGCNKALLTMLDVPVLWLESVIEELIVPRTDQSISESVLSKELMDLLPSGERVSSREIGKSLHLKKIGRVSVGTEIKRIYGGLQQFVAILSDLFVTTPRPEVEDHSFWISLQPDAEERWKQLYEEGSSDRQSLPELLAAREARNTLPQKAKATIEQSAESYGEIPNKPSPAAQYFSRNLPKAIPDYWNFKVTELRELCRELGLPVTGTKGVLRHRIDDFVESMGQSSDNPLEDYLLGLVLEYLKACGGRATSREVGRYLSANPACDAYPASSALKQLKDSYGSLAQFVKVCEHALVRLETDLIDERNELKIVFEIGVRQPQEALVTTQ